MAFLDDLRGEYNQLSDPNYFKRLISEKQALYRPELEKTFDLVDADLNRRGMFSAAPVARSRFRAAGEFNRGISEQTNEEVMRRWQTVLPLIARMEALEKEGKLRDRAGWMKLIGTIVGTGAGFLIGGPPGAIAGATAGRGIGSVSAPPMDFTPWTPPR